MWVAEMTRWRREGRGTGEGILKSGRKCSGGGLSVELRIEAAVMEEHFAGEVEMERWSR